MQALQLDDFGQACSGEFHLINLNGGPGFKMGILTRLRQQHAWSGSLSCLRLCCLGQLPYSLTAEKINEQRYDIELPSDFKEELVPGVAIHSIDVGNESQAGA